MSLIVGCLNSGLVLPCLGVAVSILHRLLFREHQSLHALVDFLAAVVSTPVTRTMLTPQWWKFHGDSSCHDLIETCGTLQWWKSHGDSSCDNVIEARVSQ